MTLFFIFMEEFLSRFKSSPTWVKIVITIVVLLVSIVSLFSCHAQRRAVRTTFRQISTQTYDTIKADYYIHRDSKSFNQTNIDHNVLHNQIKAQ